MASDTLSGPFGTAEQLLSGLAQASPAEPYVIAQLGQSLDGRIATPTGESRWINGQEALTHVHRLRALVDAVVVGIGTVVADDPQLTVRRVKGANPARVVIDPNGRMPANARLLHDGAAPTFLIRASEPEAPAPATAQVLTLTPGPSGHLEPHAIVKALGEAGFKKVLIEGGAQTVSRFLDADAIDELHLLVAPMIIGSGTTGLQLRAIDKISKAHRPSMRVARFADGDMLFACQFRNATERA